MLRARRTVAVEEEEGDSKTSNDGEHTIVVAYVERFEEWHSSEMFEALEAASLSRLTPRALRRLLWPRLKRVLTNKETFMLWEEDAGVTMGGDMFYL